MYHQLFYENVKFYLLKFALEVQDEILIFQQYYFYL